MRGTHIDPALHNRSQMESWNPYARQEQMFLGKVVAVHADTGTVDVALDASSGQGGFYSRIPVLSWSYASQTGQTYMPSNIDLAAPMPSAQGTYDQPISSGKQDVWCVCAHLSGRAQRPVCIGFIAMPGAWIHTKDPGYDVKLHESGVSWITTPDGQVQINLPDGSNLVIGTGTAPLDMTTQNPAWNPKTTTTAYNVTLNLNGNVNLTVNGSATINATEVYLGAATGSGAAVARVGDSVNLTTGVIETGSAKVFSG